MAHMTVEEYVARHPGNRQQWIDMQDLQDATPEAQEASWQEHLARLRWFLARIAAMKTTTAEARGREPTPRWWRLECPQCGFILTFKEEAMRTCPTCGTPMARSSLS